MVISLCTFLTVAYIGVDWLLRDVASSLLGCIIGIAWSIKVGVACSSM